MKIKELQKKLEVIAAEHGDLDILINVDYRSQQNPSDPTVEIAEANQYPADWGMPEGFKFAELFVDF